MELLRPLVTIFCILACPAAHAAEALHVLAPGDPVAEDFPLRHPKKEHLTARQVYELGYPSSAVDAIGKFVLLDVVITIERDVPLADIVIPKDLPPGFKPVGGTISASLINATALASSCKQGQRFRIEGIIVAEGFGAYKIYVARLQLLK